MTPRLALHIPQPCSANWAAMTPTAHGRHCGACQTEVVDFTRLSNAEILAFLAQRGGRPVCASVHTSQVAAPAPTRWRRWLLAALAVLGGQTPAPAGPPALPPLTTAGNQPPTPDGQVIVRGTVLDDQSGEAVAGARILIKDTPYGTVTDAQGRFELVLAAAWPPLKSGKFLLRIEGSPFNFQPQDRTVSVPRPAQPITLKIRLLSVPNRGRMMGRAVLPKPPVEPPRP